MASVNEHCFFTKISRTALYLRWIPSKLDPVINSEIGRQKLNINTHGHICRRPFSDYAIDCHFDCHLYLHDFRFYKRGNYLIRYGSKIICNLGILGISLLCDVQLRTLGIHAP